MIDHRNSFKVTTRDGEIAIDGLAGPPITLTPAEALNLAAWLATLGAQHYRDPDGLDVRFAFAALLASVENEA